MWQVVMTIKGLHSEQAARFLAEHLRSQYASSDDQPGDITIEAKKEKS